MPVRANGGCGCAGKLAQLPPHLADYRRQAGLPRSTWLGEVSAPVPAPTAAPIAAPSRGAPTMRPPTAPTPAPIPAPLKARSPVVSPQPVSAMSDTAAAAKKIRFMTYL